MTIITVLILALAAWILAQGYACSYTSTDRLKQHSEARASRALAIFEQEVKALSSRCQMAKFAAIPCSCGSTAVEHVPQGAFYQCHDCGIWTYYYTEEELARSMKAHGHRVIPT